MTKPEFKWGSTSKREQREIHGTLRGYGVDIVVFGAKSTLGGWMWGYRADFGAGRTLKSLHTFNTEAEARAEVERIAPVLAEAFAVPKG